MRRTGVNIIGSAVLIAAFAGTASVSAQEIGWNEFSYWDSDESGDISQAEWEGGMESIELDLNEQPETQNDEKAELYDTYQDYDSVDLNEDSRIDRQEYKHIREKVEN